MSLSVCLVTRNEEENIGRAVRSVAGVADEVVVADTGSTDRTAEAAAALGARVSQFPWGDDFSAARNYAVERASGDWVLWLNPDEELLPEGRQRLAEALARPDALAYLVRVRDRLTPGPPAKEAETPQVRLFRRDAGVRYAGRLHPHFEPDLEELAARTGKMVYALDATILRHGYLSKLTPDKLRWAARLLELELRDRPGQLRYLVEYGRTLLLLNDPRGHEVLAEAADQVLAARDAHAAPGAPVGSLLEYVLTVAPGQSKCRMTPAEAEGLALRWFARTPPVVWALAQRRFKAGDFPGAAELLEKLLEMGRTGAYDHGAGFDPEIMGAPALMNLGVCYLRAGDWDRARHCFGQLLTHPTYQAQARANLALAESRTRPAG
jgi:hypothetical protein